MDSIRIEPTDGERCLEALRAAHDGWAYLSGHAPVQYLVHHRHARALAEAMERKLKKIPAMALVKASEVEAIILHGMAWDKAPIRWVDDGGCVLDPVEVVCMLAERPAGQSA
jgi:sugar phosphate isomerase/epimerase